MPVPFFSIDEAWSSPNKVQAYKADGVTPDPGYFTVNMRRAIGTNGETTIRIGVKPGTSNFITAYPVP